MWKFASASAVGLLLALGEVQADAQGAPVLRPCQGAAQYLCGEIGRPLDPAGEVPGTVRVHFEVLPRRDRNRPSLGVIVGAEGGPGYPSTGSRAIYRALFAPLLDRRELVVIDNRGTGRSGLIDCAPLQREPVMLLEDVARCGEQLGARADLYGSGLAADDLAAVLDALGVAKIDLYGDSYGTFFAQAFAGRHPERLRSLVLDGAYAVVGASPWYPSQSPTMRHAFDVVCERALGCHDLPGTSMQRIVRLLRSLRAAPRSSLEPTALAFIMYASGLEPIAFRELDAAARAYTDERDAVPLMRLARENAVGNEAAGPARSYSRGLFSAVSCADYPQAYDMRSPPRARGAQWRDALEQEQETAPNVYAPFTIAEYLRIPPDFSVLPLCLNWPTPSLEHPPGEPVPPGAHFTRAATLVLSGELDSTTTPAEAAEAAALFPHSKHLIFANSWHVDAVGDLNHCASLIVRRFIERLDPGDTSCAQSIAEVRTVPSFSRFVSGVTPAAPLEGNRATERELRAAAAAVQTIGDTIGRSWIVGGSSRAGLRGGRFGYTIDGSVYRFRLDAERWVEDLAVTGTATWDTAGGLVWSHVTVAGNDGERGTIDARWGDRERHAFATIGGEIDGRSVRARMPAP